MNVPSHLNISLDKVRKRIYYYVMGTIISPDGHFEWEDDKDASNKENHGFYFEEILAAFDDQFFLEAYNSTLDEIRWKGITSFDRTYLLLHILYRAE